MDLLNYRVNFRDFTSLLKEKVTDIYVDEYTHKSHTYTYTSYFEPSHFDLTRVYMLH